MKTGKWGYTINLCVLVALCEETEGLSFPTRSGYNMEYTIFYNSSLERFDPLLSPEKTKKSLTLQNGK